MDELPKLLATGLISFIIGILLRGIADRRALVQSVADRYFDAARTNSELQEDQYLRIAALQSAGAAELRPWEFSRLRRRIVARGFRDPGEDLPLFSDRRPSRPKITSVGLQEEYHLWLRQRRFFVSQQRNLMRRQLERKTPNQAMEPTPPDLLMSLFAVQPAACSLPRSRRRGSSWSR